MALFSMTKSEKGKSLFIYFDDGTDAIISESHVSYDLIYAILTSGEAYDEEELRDLTKVVETANRKMTELSERVSYDGTELLFDGDPVDSVLGDVIKEQFTSGSMSFRPLVAFLEKAATNPSVKSIDDLYRWTRNGDLVIAPDGDIIAYKGLKVDEDGNSVSIHAGRAFVDGVEAVGNIPNKEGSVITMPRSDVDPDSESYCSHGLHAGTYSYANSFARGRLVTVKINPRDVVSVPSDSECQKMRVCRYVVLSDIEQRIETHTYGATGYEDEGYEDLDGASTLKGEDTCEFCGAEMDGYEVAEAESEYPERGALLCSDCSFNEDNIRLCDICEDVLDDDVEDLCDLCYSRYGDPEEDEEDDEEGIEDAPSDWRRFASFRRSE